MRRSGELAIAGKLMVRVGSRKLILAKGAQESQRHVLLKALVFARYVDRYPELRVERGIGLRYKPDLVEVGPYQAVRFWAECGETSRRKIGWLVSHVREGHLVFARQSRSGDAFTDLVADAIGREGRNGLVEVLTFDDDAWSAIRDDGSVDPADLRPVVRSFAPART